MDTTLIWPTQEIEIPLTTPPKGRPNQKRPLSSPETTPYTTVKHKKKKAKRIFKLSHPLVIIQTTPLMMKIQMK